MNLREPVVGEYGLEELEALYHPVLGVVLLQTLNIGVHIISYPRDPELKTSHNQLWVYCSPPGDPDHSVHLVLPKTL
jgi:hypothetical protein